MTNRRRAKGVRLYRPGLVDLEALSLHDRDVLLISEPAGHSIKSKHVASLAARLEGLGLRDVLIVALPAGATVEQLDEAAMSRHGWVRATPFAIGNEDKEA